MAITKLTNTQIQGVINEAYRQFTGAETTENRLDLSNFTDTGSNEVGALRSQFTGKLLGVLTKNWFTDTEYHSRFNEVFFETTQQFGALIQTITAKIPEAIESSSWKQFSNGDVIGTYKIAIPEVDTKIFSKSESFAIPITITGSQWDTAFRSEEDLADFVAYLFMMVDNAITLHIEHMNRENLANFIGEKLNAQAENVAGTHAVNLVEEYSKTLDGGKSMTVSEFLADKNALLFAIEKINLLVSYMQEPNVIFNTEGYTRFVPRDRLAVMMLTPFVQRLYTAALSGTFHDDMVALPLYREVPCWQSMADLSFNGLSSINIKTADGNVVNRGGVVACILDKWGVAFTIREHRVGSRYFEIEDLSHYEYQFRDSLINNLSLPGVVLYLEDYTEPTEPDEP